MVQPTDNTAKYPRCNNCGESAPTHQMLSVSADNRILARICPNCQRAKKIQITLDRNPKGELQYYQYFPVEA